MTAFLSAVSKYKYPNISLSANMNDFFARFQSDASIWRLHLIAACIPSLPCQKSNYLRPPNRALLPSVGKNLHFHAFSGVSINSKSFQLWFAATTVTEFRLFVGGCSGTEWRTEMYTSWLTTRLTTRLTSWLTTSPNFQPLFFTIFWRHTWH